MIVTGMGTNEVEVKNYSDNGQLNETVLCKSFRITAVKTCFDKGTGWDGLILSSHHRRHRRRRDLLTTTMDRWRYETLFILI